MKEKLLSFYRTLKVKGKSYWKSQLFTSTLNNGEALDLYGIRLLGIAELAFPQSKKEYANQVRCKFLDSIPRTISTRILEAERAMKTFSGGKAKYLSFTSMMEMAKELQEECPPVTVQTVMWSEKRTYFKSRECSPSPPIRQPGVTKCFKCLIHMFTCYKLLLILELIPIFNVNSGEWLSCFQNQRETD